MEFKIGSHWVGENTPHISLRILQQTMMVI